MSRRASGHEITNPKLLEIFAFLAKPNAFYDARSQTDFLKHINTDHPSIYFGASADEYPKRLTLKKALDRISEVAGQVFERKKFYRRDISGIAFALKTISHLAVERDYNEVGLYHKFFNGTNTLEAVVINQATFCLGEMKAALPARRR